MDEEYIYTGGESTESVYWSKDPATYVIHFYWEHLPPAGWDVGDNVPTLTAQPTKEKDPNVHQTATLTATRDGFRVTVIAVDNVQKDPARGHGACNRWHRANRPDGDGSADPAFSDAG